MEGGCIMDKKQGLFGIKDGIYLIIAPLVIILPIAYWYFTAPPPGFCVAQNRFIPDGELTQTSLVLLEFQRNQDKLRWNTDPKLYENYIKSYEILQQNRKRNGFIELDRSDTHSIFSRLLGYQQIQVILNANSGDGQIRFYYNVCGKLLHSEIGLRDTTYQTITTTDYPKISNGK
jgi:hypothetical protein